MFDTARLVFDIRYLDVRLTLHGCIISFIPTKQTEFDVSDLNVRLKPNPNDFVQVTRGHLRDLRELAKRSPASWHVFMLLTERMNRGNAIVVSQTTMAKILGYTRPTVNIAIKLLETERWLQVVKVGQANAYVLNSKVVWRDVGGKRFAGFYAEVLVSEEEQGRPIEDWDNIELRQVPLLGENEHPLLDDAPLPPPDQADLIPPSRDEFARQSKAFNG
jgi:hypothetical protein